MPMALVEGAGADVRGLVRTASIDRPQTPPGIMATELAEDVEVEAAFQDDDLADGEDDNDQEEGEDMPTATGATRTRRAPTHGSRLDTVEADVSAVRADVSALKTDVAALKTGMEGLGRQNTQIIQMLTSFGMTPPPADGSGGVTNMTHSGPSAMLAMRMVSQALGPLGTVGLLIYLLATGKIH